MSFSKENQPKTKDDWNALKEENIELWSELTQENYDRTLREKRELEQKHREAETQKNNLTLELEKYKTTVPAGSGIVVPKIEPPKPYSRENLPKTEKEWQNLFALDSVKATDLRNYYLNSTTEQEKQFTETRTRAVKALQEEHPDMYELELDETNQPKRDEKGKLVLKRDPKTGEPIFNANSEKGKLWDQLYNENPGIDSHANAPELLQAQLERKLRLKGGEIVQQAQSQREKEIAEGQVIGEGVPPPAAVRLTFRNEDEKFHAQRMVDKGLYKSLTDYVVNRDKKDDGIFDENRTPSFTKK